MHSDGTFARLLAPSKVEDFFSHYWEKAPLHIRRESPDYYAEFLTVEDLDRYFQADNLSPSFVRVVKSGRDCEIDNWTVVEKRKNTDSYRVVAVDKLFSLFSSGATIIINAAQAAIPQLKAQCAALEQELRTRIQFNIYVTPARARGLGPHYDQHDVFILQLSGSKQWQLYDGPSKLPVSGALTNPNEYENSEARLAVKLATGDLLYVPRGTVHVTGTSDVSSVHITVALMSRYRFNLIDELARVAEGDEAFRRALPHGFSTEEEKSAFATGFKQQLQDLVAGVDVATLLDRVQRDFNSNREVARQARLTDLLDADRLTLDSVVASRADIDYHVERSASNLTITLGNATLSLPNFIGTNLEQLLRTGSFSPHQLTGQLTDAGKLELVRRFLLAGLLTIEAI